MLAFLPAHLTTLDMRLWQNRRARQRGRRGTDKRVFSARQRPFLGCKQLYVIDRLIISS
jgi:hypothetical protein